MRRAALIDQLMVATSDDRADDPLALLCAQIGIDCYRGQLDDVLDRFYQAALPHRPDYVVRLTGDCPLADPELIDRVIRQLPRQRAATTSAMPARRPPFRMAWTSR